MPPTPTNWAEGYWTHRYQLGFEKYFDFITDHSKVRNGDWCIWEKNSSYSLSHIAMYLNGEYFGERQNGNLFFCLAKLKNDWAGALRWKGWTYGMSIGSWERKYDQYAGVDIVVVGMPDADGLTLISAKNNNAEVDGYAVQRIQDIDDPYHVYDMKLNAGFFDNAAGSKTFGEAYGVRCGVNEWSVPRQGKFIYYAVMKDGRTEIGLDNNFWYTPDQCICASSPALVLMYNGEDVEYVSPCRTDRRTLSCCQSVLIRTKDRFLFAISKGKLAPDQIKAWAKTIDGVQDLVFNDGGGSACIQYGYDVITATGENRKIANAWAFYHDKAITPSTASVEPSMSGIPVIDGETPSEVSEQPVTVSEDVVQTVTESETEIPVIIPGSESEEVESNMATADEKKTVRGQLAKLIDVKSIITLSLTLAFVRLALLGSIDEQQMMTIYTVIIGFYFGTQATKGTK